MPEITDAERLSCLLERSGQWMQSADIARLLCWQTRSGNPDDRRIRRAASNSRAAILSWPGSTGYHWTKSATIEEVRHAMSAFDSQEREMRRRQIELHNVYYGREMTESKQEELGI